MDDPLFDDYTPWDRLLAMETRLAHMERNLQEVLRCLNTQHGHLVELNRTVTDLHKKIWEIEKWRSLQ